jgi:hypothetical protein
MALLAEQIPADGRGGGKAIIVEADLLGARQQRIGGLAGLRDARKIALDVGCENRHAHRGEPFRQDLQRHRLAGPGGTGDQAMAIGQRQVEDLFVFLGAAGANQNAIVGHRQNPRIGAWPGSFPHAFAFESCAPAT